MLENRHSGDDLAQMLSIHRRTLNRRLKAEGTTFQRVLDEVRFDIARDLLSNSNVHLDDIAATLGYAAVTPFMRTFRRWSGTTPGQWRRSVRKERARRPPERGARRGAPIRPCARARHRFVGGRLSRFAKTRRGGAVTIGRDRGRSAQARCRA